MPKTFEIGALATAIYDPGAKTFTGWREDHPDDRVTYQDEYDGKIYKQALKVGDPVEYGFKILAGECSINKRTIVFLRVDCGTRGVLTFRYLKKSEPTEFRFTRAKAKPFEDPPQDPDPESDPTTYPDTDPDPDSDTSLPNFDDTAGDDPDSGNGNGCDDPDDPPTGDGSDCDGTIGISA